MDDTDFRILRMMQKHPDATIGELAEKAGLSQTPCWRRLKKMQDDGVVRGRSWLLDPSALGLSVNVFAEVRLKQHDEETLELFEKRTREVPEIVECFSMSGASDYLLRILVGSVADYEKLLKRTLLHLPSVASVNSNFALAPIKVTNDLPI